jgi:hypothetical protein
VKKTRNAPASIWVISALIVGGAVFNFALGLLFSLAPENLKAIDVTKTPTGAPPQLLVLTGVACIALGFVYFWVLKELHDKSHFAVVMIYTLSSINMLFGLFRLPLGLIFISINLIGILLIRSSDAREWLNSPS